MEPDEKRVLSPGQDLEGREGKADKMKESWSRANRAHHGTPRGPSEQPERGEAAAAGCCWVSAAPCGQDELTARSRQPPLSHCSVTAASAGVTARPRQPQPALPAPQVKRAGTWQRPASAGSAPAPAAGSFTPEPETGFQHGLR